MKKLISIAAFLLLAFNASAAVVKIQENFTTTNTPTTVTNIILSLIGTNGGSGGGGAAVSNAVGLTFVEDTRYTNSTAYYAEISAAINLSQVGGAIASMTYYQDINLDGTADFNRAYSMTMASGTHLIIPVIREIVPPGAAYAFTNSSGGGSIASFVASKGAVTYYSTNSGSGGSGLQTGNSTDATNVNLTVTGTLRANSQSNTTLIAANAYFPHTNAGAAFDADGKLTSIGGVNQDGLAAGDYPIDGGALAFSELYTAWVSKYGDNSTGTVGKRERPFAGVSNAVYAVKTALGSANTNGVVYIGAGLWDEHLVNLQRTNLPGISLIGQGGWSTLLTSRSTSSLTNIGALVLVGHSTRVIGVSISNDMSCAYKQAAIGYDLSRAAAQVGTLVVPTNVYINVPFGRGSSDVGYFYDSTGPSQYDITIEDCDWQSKWDAVFLSTLEPGGQFRIKRSNIRVIQPDGYSFPGLGSGSGRARAVYIGDGDLTVENSSIVAVGGNVSTNEVTGLTFNSGSGVGYTNINSFIDAQGSSGTITREILVDAVQTLGKLSAASITGPFSSISNSGKYNGIKVYRALLVQSGTAAPTATVLENSLGGTPSWARTDVGVYTCNTSALFPSGKTLSRIALHAPNFLAGATLEYATTSQIILRTTDEIPLGLQADGVLATGSNIEILVYP